MEKQWMTPSHPEEARRKILEEAWELLMPVRYSMITPISMRVFL